MTRLTRKPSGPAAGGSNTPATLDTSTEPAPMPGHSSRVTAGWVALVVSRMTRTRRDSAIPSHSAVAVGCPWSVEEPTMLAGWPSILTRMSPSLRSQVTVPNGSAPVVP